MNQTPELWPLQVAGIDGVRRARADGFRRICLTAPTGCGKTAIMRELIREELGRGGRVSLYTNRTMLREQTSGVMVDAGLDHGVRAAGSIPDPSMPFQVSSVQTEASRVTKRKVWDVHPATLVIVDEFHLFANDTWARLSNAHYDAGATIVGVTATPIGVGAVCDTLVVAGTTSDGRKCGALVPAYHYGSSEPWVPDVQKRTLERGEDPSEKEVVKAIMRPGIFGLVFDEWKRLNPQGLPTILFGPGVGESLWFAEQFAARGVPAAHIDGENVWINGREYRSDRAARDAAMEGSRDGSVRILCNRFVLREGIDCPWLGHGILATVFGSLQSYLQSGGRLLRSHPGITSVVVQDHGGCLDTNTEVLTARGWIGHTAIRDDDTVAAYDRFSGSIRWCKILHRHERILEAGEKMFEAKGRCLDIRVTGNHRILTAERDNVDAGKVWRDAYEFMRADDLSSSAKRVKIPVSGVQQMTGVRLTDDQLRFLGWWVTDGTMAGKRQQVRIVQAAHQPQLADLRSCLVACGFDFKEYRRAASKSGFPGGKEQAVFDIPKGTCAARPRKGWWELRNYMEKDLALHMELMDERQFGVFLHAVHLGDGSKTTSERKEGSYRIATGNKTFADRLQSLAVRRGWKCNIHTDRQVSRLNPVYILNMQRVTNTTMNGSEAKSEYDVLKLVESPSIPGVTKVWCVANELETLVTRRNGMVAIIGNSWHRHGSLNADRQWDLSMTAAMIAGERIERLREKQEAEPLLCPQCRCVLAKMVPGRSCPACGFAFEAVIRSRPVMMEDGRLVEQGGDIYKPKVRQETPDSTKVWLRCYFQAFNSGYMTFRQAEAMFVQELHFWPLKNLKFMPLTERGWYRRVVDVPRGELYS